MPIAFTLNKIQSFLLTTGKQIILSLTTLLAKWRQTAQLQGYPQVCRSAEIHVTPIRYEAEVNTIGSL